MYVYRAGSNGHIAVAELRAIPFIATLPIDAIWKINHSKMVQQSDTQLPELNMILHAFSFSETQALIALLGRCLSRTSCPPPQRSSRTHRKKIRTALGGGFPFHWSTIWKLEAPRLIHSKLLCLESQNPCFSCILLCKQRIDLSLLCS